MPTIRVSLRLRPSLSIDEPAVADDGAAAPATETPQPRRSRSVAPPGTPHAERPEVLVDSQSGSAEQGIASYGEKRFKFAHAFGASASTDDVFEAQRDAISGVLRGFDATLMAYGSTGAGKTHTMMGTEAQPGLVPLALDALFDEMAAGSMSYALQVSALELLEERCVDLLHERAAVVLRAGGGGAGGGLNFSGLREVPISTKAQLLGLIATATASRTVGSNHRHDASSRSHLVLRLRVDGARLVRLGSMAAAAVDAEGAAAEDCDGGEGGGGGDLASSVSLRDATSATLTLVDLAGSEAATQNASHAAVAQGVHINKSLHWLKVAVHELAAKRVPSTLRNSALTRLLAPSLAGGAHVALVVCSSSRPALSAMRDALETLAFGEVAARVALKPTRRTEVSGGQLGKLQALLVQMADDRQTLATDAAALREQVGAYEEMISELRAGFVSKESLHSAEDHAKHAEAELERAHARNDALMRRCADEEASKAALAMQLLDVEAAAFAARERNHLLLERTQEAADERAALEERLAIARTDLDESRREADAREAELHSHRDAVDALQTQMHSLEAQLAAEREAASVREAEAAALAESNSALEERAARARDSALAKDQLVLLRHKLYTQKRRPNSAAAAQPPAALPPAVHISDRDVTEGAHCVSGGRGAPPTRATGPPTLMAGGGVWQGSREAWRPPSSEPH